MSIDDPMAWLEDGEPATLGEHGPAAAELERVESSARLALYNVVRRAFEAEAANGLTRQHLADRLGVSRALVSRWLAKPRNITIETAAKLMYGMGRELKVADRSDAASQPAWSTRTYSAANVISLMTGKVRVVTADGVIDADAHYRRMGEVGMLDVNCARSGWSAVFEQVDGLGAGTSGTLARPLPLKTTGSLNRVSVRSPAVENA